jgi:geranylgeranyl diphosphate synthase type I
MALIHDDVMDRSEVRRNRASTFRALAELATGVVHSGDPQSFGASAAILTGLLGFVLADRLFASCGFDPESVRRASHALDRMRASAIAGQYLDLLAAHRGDADEPTARRIAALKSGSYTVAEPLAIGALLATDGALVVDVLGRYGRPLGEAFQIRDDVLGTFGDPVITGKDADGDMREGKQTVLLAIAKRRADPYQRRVLDRHIGDPELSPRQAEQVRDVMAATGALDEAERLIVRLTDEAKSAIVPGAIEHDARDALIALADAATMRLS